MRTPLNSRLALAVVALLGLTGAAAHAQIGETYYIPLPSTQVKIWADTQTNLAENDILRVGIALTVTAPEFWLYFLGALFIAVTLFLPNGVVGLVKKLTGGRKP